MMCVVDRCYKQPYVDLISPIGTFPRMRVGACHIHADQLYSLGWQIVLVG